jgi:small conductance mechanosensitive channel
MQPTEFPSFKPFAATRLALALVTLALLVCLSWPGAGQAQTTDPAPRETDAAPDGTAPVDATAGERPFPVGLDDPSIGAEDLSFQILPLTAEELAPLAEAWQANLRSATEAVVETGRTVRDAGDAASALARERRRAAIDANQEISGKLGIVISSLEAKGGDPDLVASLESYRRAIALHGARMLSADVLLERAVGWLTSRDGGVRLAAFLASVVAALLGLLIVARFVSGWADRVFRRLRTLSQLLRRFLVRVVYWLTVTVGLVLVLAAFGVNMTPLLALIGGASFIIAFAMQDTLGNLAAGLMILLNRPFDEGDYVSVAGVGGTVQQVSVVSTTITTPDNQVIVIPNSRVWGDIITNVTASDVRRVDLSFAGSYDDPVGQVRGMLEDVVLSHPSVLADPAPVVEVNALRESAMEYIVRPWVRTEDYWTTYWDLTRQVREAFDERGLSIPFPRTTVHLRPDTPQPRGGRAAAQGTP